MALSADGAAAGEFAVANCQADPLNFSTRAFDDFATRGMKIKRACDPEGPGLRGLITEQRRARRPRPARRGGDGDDQRARRDPLHELPLGGHGAAARLPLRAAALRRGARHPADRDQERAREPALPAPARAPRAAGYRSRTFNVTGATRIVQRVICVGGDGRKSCSARGVELPAHLRGRGRGSPTSLAPAAAILGDTPLARGEWVRRNTAAELRRQRQRRRAHAPRDRRWSDRRLPAAALRVRRPRAHVRGPRAVPERRPARSTSTRRAFPKARRHSSCRPRTPPGTSETRPR